jgi:hypothetical protein
MIVYDAGYDEMVRDTLNRCQTTGYTLWQRVLGTGRRSDPKMDDSVWPGYNHTLMAAVEDDPCLESLWSSLEALQERLGGKGIKVFCWPLERVL